MCLWKTQNNLRCRILSRFPKSTMSSFAFVGSVRDRNTLLDGSLRSHELLSGSGCLESQAENLHRHAEAVPHEKDHSFLPGVEAE